MNAAELAERFQVHVAVARRAIAAGVELHCAELAERDSEPAKGFAAAVYALTHPGRRVALIPRLPGLADVERRLRLSRESPSGAVGGRESLIIPKARR